MSGDLTVCGCFRCEREARERLEAEEARQRADFVLVATAPVLATEPDGSVVSPLLGENTPTIQSIAAQYEGYKQGFYNDPADGQVFNWAEFDEIGWTDDSSLGSV